MPSPNAPLAGLRVLVLRPRAQAAGLLRRLRAEGALPAALPAIEIRPAPAGPLRRAAREAAAGRLGWIVLTSANGARAWRSALRAARVGPRDLRAVRIAAIGGSTAAAIRAAGLRVGRVPRPHTGPALAGAFRRILRGARGARARRILLLQPDLAPPDLARQLRAAGGEVRRVMAYRTAVPRAFGPALRRALRQGEAWAILTSASSARFLARAAGRARRDALRCVSIGPATTRAARRAGLRVEGEAKAQSEAGLVAALKKAAQRCVL